MRRVFVLVLPNVHALDLAGPVQALYEANGFGANYRLHYVGSSRSVVSAQGFQIAELAPLPSINARDWVLVPGTESSHLDELEVPDEWLRRAVACGARVTSVCSGAFAFAKAGLLEGRQCTTHWKVTQRLREWCPTARVLENRLFVRDGNVLTSAGVASGIDMALALIEEDHGPELVARVAREMVVYMRRDGSSSQLSIYLEHRAHTHPGVHRAQDWIVAHPDRTAKLSEVAGIAGVSARHLTRVFKESTGVTINAFAHKVKLELARTLITESNLCIEEIASRCGFKDARHLRRIWQKEFGRSPTQSRKQRRPAA